MGETASGAPAVARTQRRSATGVSNKMRISEVAERTGRSRGTIERWISHGVQVNERNVRLKATRLGGLFEVDEADFEAFVAGCNPEPTAPVETPSARSWRLAEGKAEAMRMSGG